MSARRTRSECEEMIDPIITYHSFNEHPVGMTIPYPSEVSRSRLRRLEDDVLRAIKADHSVFVECERGEGSKEIMKALDRAVEKSDRSVDVDWESRDMPVYGWGQIVGHTDGGWRVSITPQRRPCSLGKACNGAPGDTSC